VSAGLAHNENEVRLMQSIFTYVASCLKDQDKDAARRLRLRPDQIERISQMTTADFLRLSELAKGCVEVDVDSKALDDVFRRMDERRHRESLIDRCMRADAPREMMTAFFGLSRHRYARLRALHDVPASVGRCPRPTPEIERRIYEHWQACRQCWSAQTLLEIADQLDVSLRTVWHQVKQAKAAKGTA
jgi:hypothetical protein